MGRVKNGIYKRGKSYYFQIKINGVRHRKSCGPNKHVAEIALAKLREEVAVGRLTKNYSGLGTLLKPQSTLNFSEALSSYISERSLKASTALAYNDRSKVLLDRFGSTLIIEITEERIRQFQVGLSSTRSPRRVNAIVNLLRSVLDQCTRRGIIQESPAKVIDRLEEGAANIDPLSREELDMVFQNASPRFRPVFICLAWTGMRPGELKALRWKDIDFTREEILINKARYNNQEALPKTRSSNRIIRMLPPVLEALTELRQNAKVFDMDGHVFLNAQGQPIDSGFDTAWARAIAKAGLRHRPSYQLRHTFASNCLQSGADPSWIARMLGHSNAQITFRHYARFINSTQSVNEQRISEALFKQPPIETAGTTKGATAV